MKFRHQTFKLHPLPFLFASDQDPDIRQLFTAWKTILALKTFYQHFPEDSHLSVSQTEGQNVYLLQLKRTYDDSQPGLPYCRHLFDIIHQSVCLRKKNRPLKRGVEVSRGRLMRTYLKDLSVIGLYVTPRSLSLKFSHQELSSVQNIDHIPGFLAFEHKMNDMVTLLTMSITLTCRNIKFDMMKSASPIPAVESLTVTPSSVSEEHPPMVEISPTNVLAAVLTEPSSMLHLFQENQALKLVSDVIYYYQLLTAAAWMNGDPKFHHSLFSNHVQAETSEDGD